MIGNMFRGLLLAALLTAITASAQTSLVSTGAVWKYLDTGTNLNAAWRAAGFDDTAWPSGPAQLGYGDSDEATVTRSTNDVDGSRIITTYFRHSFNVANAGSISNLLLRLLRDDGAVV